MAFHQAYVTDTFKPTTEQGMEGNETNPNPVEFDLLPAEGADIAHIKSMLVATIGITSNDIPWTAEAQNAIVSAFVTGAPAFINTIEAIRNYTVPAALAKRAGLISEYPTHIPAGRTQGAPNRNAKVPVTTGLAFSKVCGFNMALSLQLAREIMRLTRESGQDIRFFEQLSGSGGAETPSPQTSTAEDAAAQPGEVATAENPAPAANRNRGSSRRKR